MSGPEARGPRPVIAAVSISIPVAQFLSRPRRGEVLATFARSVYLDLDGSIVAVVAEELLNGPLNIVLPADAAPPFDRLTAGGAVAAAADAITIDRWPTIALRGAARWNPRITPWTAGQMVRVVAHLRVLGDAVMAETSTDHLMHPRMQQALAILRSALSARSSVDIQSAAAGLAGLGGGLTPSGDDVLVGVLVALTALPDRLSDSLRDVIGDATAGRTIRISEAYLRAAVRGEASEAWQRLLAALAGASPDNVIAAGRRVLAFGETSGADMLAGFLLAMSALMDRGDYLPIG